VTSYPHRIRLRGPWECEPLRAAAAGAPLPAPRHVTLPAGWGEAGLPGFAGVVRFRRRFGYPGRIDPYERVWLTCAGVTGTAEVWLNGRPLGRHEGPFEHEVTALLRPRNELVAEVEAADDRGGLSGEVALEVRRTAFLRNLRAWLAGDGAGVRLHVAGEVVGTSERPLELYALLGGRTVAYAGAEAAPEGRPFQLASEVLEEGQRQARLARVDLVDGAVIWSAAEVAVDAPGTPAL
jgi:hypothetical protein